MENEDLKPRTQRFAIRIINLATQLTQTNAGYIISGQIMRSATSVGANYRAARRAKSSRDFINKLKIVEEETDETIYWLEVIEETKLVEPEKMKALKTEANELLSIFVTSIKTAKKRTKYEERSTKNEVRRTKYEERSTKNEVRS